MTPSPTIAPGANARIAALPQAITLLWLTSLAIMGGAPLSPSLPGLRDHFGTAPDIAMLTRLLMTLPSLTIAIASPVVGWALDRFGRRRVVLGSILLYAIAGTSGLYLHSIHAILVGRGLLGIAMAGTLAGATTLVGDYYHGLERGRMLGLQAGVSAFAGVIYLLLAGVLADVGWRVPFWMYASALPLLFAATTTLFEPERDRTGHHADGSVHHEPLPARVLTLVVVLYVASVGIQIAFFMIPVQLPFFLEELGEASPRRAGIALATMTLCAAVVAISYRWLQLVVDRVFILTLSLALLGTGLVLTSLAHDFQHVILAQIVCGMGMGLNFTNLSTWLLARTPAHVRGRVMGGLLTCICLGQFLSPVVVAPLARAGLAPAYERVGLGVLAGAAVCVLAGVHKTLSRRGARASRTP